MRTCLTPVLLALALAACAPPIGRADAGRADAGTDGSPDASTSTSTDAGDDGPDAGPLFERNSCRLFCSVVFQECFQGECLDTCYADSEGADEDCEAHEYCHRENVCVPRQLPSCAEVPCIDDQVCVGGFCVLPTGIGCVGEDTQDDCSYSYVCDALRGQCVVPPVCNQDGTCPPGTLGAVCNGSDETTLDDNMAPDICLLGQCRDDRDCPPSRRCEAVGTDGGVALGWCRPRPAP